MLGKHGIHFVSTTLLNKLVSEKNQAFRNFSVIGVNIIKIQLYGMDVTVIILLILAQS